MDWEKKIEQGRDLTYSREQDDEERRWRSTNKGKSEKDGKSYEISIEDRKESIWNGMVDEVTVIRQVGVKVSDWEERRVIERVQN